LALKCLFISFSIKAQLFSVTRADSLRQVGELNSAATEYERIYFFSAIPSEKINALFSRAACFKELGKYYDAYNSLVRIGKFEINDSIRCSANYQLALFLYLSGYFNDADKFCAKNYSIPVNTNDFKNSLLLHTLILNELHQYKAASLKAIEFSGILNVEQQQKDSLQQFIRASYEPRNLPQIKSLRKARRLSKVLPGAGLFYAGKPGKAFANIGFQLLAAGYTGANIYVGNYITSATAGLFLMRSFYTGGINQLNEEVPKINYLRTRKFNDNFKTTFISQIKRYNDL
jgi:hypothetical protein